MRSAYATRSCVRVTRSCVCACVRLCVVHARHECDAGVTRSGFATRANSPNKSRQHVVGVNEHAVWGCWTDTENAFSSLFLFALFSTLFSSFDGSAYGWDGGTTKPSLRRCRHVVVLLLENNALPSPLHSSTFRRLRFLHRFVALSRYRPASLKRVVFLCRKLRH